MYVYIHCYQSYCFGSCNISFTCMYVHIGFRCAYCYTLNQARKSRPPMKRSSQTQLVPEKKEMNNTAERSEDDEIEPTKN